MSLLRFSALLENAGLNVNDVILLRHQEQRVNGGRTAYQLWRDDKDAFRLYQSQQSISSRQMFGKPYWARFVGTPSKETMFVGLYSAQYASELQVDTPHSLGGDAIPAHQSDTYELTHDPRLAEYEARLFIDWGNAYIRWAQYAANQNKPIFKLAAKFEDPEFPGLMNFIEPLSRIPNLPASWVEVFKSAKGIYLLTCPRTKEQYVGSASAADGFYGRWSQYAANGHGGNVQLMAHETFDYQVCILEVAGSSMTLDDILALESKWKLRLQWREMGLNAN